MNVELKYCNVSISKLRKTPTNISITQIKPTNSKYNRKDTQIKEQRDVLENSQQSAENTEIDNQTGNEIFKLLRAIQFVVCYCIFDSLNAPYL